MKALALISGVKNKTETAPFIICDLEKNCQKEDEERHQNNKKKKKNSVAKFCKSIPWIIILLSFVQIGIFYGTSLETASENLSLKSLSHHQRLHRERERRLEDGGGDGKNDAPSHHSDEFDLRTQRANDFLHVHDAPRGKRPPLE